jgi:hypothetical protein
VSSPAAITVEEPQQTREQHALMDAVVGVAVVAVGADFALPVGHLTSALVVAILLAPVTVSTVLRGSRWLTWLLALGAAAVVMGIWLTAGPDPRHMALGPAVDDVSQLLTLVLGAAVVFWARTIIADHWVALLYGVGLLLRIAQAGGLFSENPWKYGFALPVTVISLSLAWAMRSQKLAFGLLLALALASALNDSRSAFALLLLTAVLLLWSRRPRHGLNRRWVGSLILLVVAFIGMYRLAETLILDGALGQATQARTQVQLQSNHSLFLGSRPEIGATLALMKANPEGFGVGIQVTPADIETAEQGMASLGHPPDVHYVEGYMFGSGVELHSVTGDLWAPFGVVGVAIALLILVFTVYNLAKEVSSASARPLLIFLGLEVLRDIVASPIGTSILVWMLFLGLMAAQSSALPRPAERRGRPRWYEGTVWGTDETGPGRNLPLSGSHRAPPIGPVT